MQGSSNKPPAPVCAPMHAPMHARTHAHARTCTHTRVHVRWQRDQDATPGTQSDQTVPWLRVTCRLGAKPNVVLCCCCCCCCCCCHCLVLRRHKHHQHNHANYRCMRSSIGDIHYCFPLLCFVAVVVVVVLGSKRTCTHCSRSTPPFSARSRTRTCRCRCTSSAHPRRPYFEPGTGSGSRTACTS